MGTPSTSPRRCGGPRCSGAWRRAAGVPPELLRAVTLAGRGCSHLTPNVLCTSCLAVQGSLRALDKWVNANNPTKKPKP